jgi:hypothetical protein
MSREGKTRFVPKVVFRTTFAGVVPACIAAAACGGNEGVGTLLAVACMAVDGGPCGAPPSDAASAEDRPVFAVAVIGFDARAPADASSDVAPDHTVLAVACTSFACLGVGVSAFADSGGAPDSSTPREGGDNG